MRKTLASVAAAALFLMWALTAQAIYGADPLPERIPTHFDFAGNINGWGGPGTLWLLPIFATFVVVVLTVSGFFPRWFNYPVAVTAENRAHMEPLAVSLIDWLRTEQALLFLWIQYVIIRSARTGRNTMSPMLLALAFAIILATVITHIAAIVQAGRESTQS